MTKPLSVGVAGLGTVGAGVLTLLRDNAATVAARAGRPIAVTAVSARDRTRDRVVSISGLRWYDDAADLAGDPGVDVVVEEGCHPCHRCRDHQSPSQVLFPHLHHADDSSFVCWRPA